MTCVLPLKSSFRVTPRCSNPTRPVCSRTLIHQFSCWSMYTSNPCSFCKNFRNDPCLLRIRSKACRDLQSLNHESISFMRTRPYCPNPRVTTLLMSPSASISWATSCASLLTTLSKEMQPWYSLTSRSPLSPLLLFPLCSLLILALSFLHSSCFLYCPAALHTSVSYIIFPLPDSPLLCLSVSTTWFTTLHPSIVSTLASLSHAPPPQFLNAPIYYISTVGTMTSLACGHCPPFSSFHAFIHGGPSQLWSNDGVIQYFYETLPPEASPAASDLFPPFLPLLPPPVSSFPSPSVENDGIDVDAAPASVFLFTTCAVVGADPLILATPLPDAPNESPGR
eukprot:31057_1